MAAGATEGPVACSEIAHADNRYTVCEVDPARDDLRLFLYDDAGAPYGEFSAIETALAAQGKHLAFAMNAGMYHEDRAPVGYYRQNGREEMRLITNAGPGNFGLLPNGLLCLTDTTAHVIETMRYDTGDRPECRDATQSGPMLVIDGKLHPRFMPDSTSRYIRNGVGTSDTGDRVVFVISRNAVTFHDFASFFRDRLGLNQALYLDGNVSRLHAPGIGRSDLGRRMGPVVGVVAPATP
nr:phosphodiester glycosidase family protein [Pseudooceanicola aestuarii]